MKALKLMIRIGLFVTILLIGTAAALVIDETESVASIDVSGASIHTLTMTPDRETLYAWFTGGPQPTGLLHSNDQGQSWEIVGSGPGMSINVLAVDPNDSSVLYAGAGRSDADSDASLWFSDDAGHTWRKFPVGLPGDADGLAPNVTAVTVDPYQTGVLYLGTESQGAYRFHLAANNLGYERIGDISLYGLNIKDIIVGPDSRAYIMSTEGLIIADEDGAEKVTSLQDVPVSLAVDPADAQTIYAGTASYGAFESNDGGQTWTAINDGLGWQPGVLLRVSAITVDEDNAEHMAVATALSVGSHVAPGGIYESFDAGQSWSKLNDIDTVIDDLTIVKGVVYAPTMLDPIQTATPAVAPSSTSFFNVQSLANPSGTQVLIMTLTLILSVLALVGRLDWRLPQHHSPA